MSAAISPINLPASIEMPSLQPRASTGVDFERVLQSAVRQVESSQATANAAIQNFISGESQELHSTILATQKAELQFEMLMQIRNKVVSAYEEVMRMQL
jgi:flagellar hook-basal body complex protein FliE